MKKLSLLEIETILKGQISTNPRRFEYANGIVFTANCSLEEMHEFLCERGVEFSTLEPNFYYTETIMSAVEFSLLDVIDEIHKVA